MSVQEELLGAVEADAFDPAGDGRYLTSAGISAGIDLTLALVEDDHGADTAREIARELVVFMQRPGGQSQFSTAVTTPPPRVGRFELPAAELARHEVKALTTKAVNAVCWANDIHSYEKEAARSSHPVNLPTLLHRRDGGTVQAAIDLAARMHDDEVAAYGELRSRVAAGPELERYLDGLQSWMRGNLTWSLSTGRYRQTPVQT